MKLSTKRKLGHVHVVAGALLSVAVRHTVPPKGASTNKKDPHRRTVTKAWCWAEEGDLAIELRRAQGNGAIVGYSYLTGDAIQLTGYPPHAAADKFEDAAALHRMKIPTPDQFDGPEAHAIAVSEQLMGLKYGDIDMAVAVVEDKSLPTTKEAAQVAEFIIGSYGYAPSWLSPEESDAKARGHFVLRVIAQKGHVVAHAQPAKHAGDFSINGFQATLLELAAANAPLYTLTAGDVLKDPEASS